MPLVNVVAGTQAQAVQAQQIIDLLKGVMTDQPVTIANELVANDFKPAGLTGSVSATRYVGGTTTSYPTTGAHVVGDWVIAQDGFLWICIGAGTPGTWKLGGADLASVAPTALAAAAVVGTSLKAAREDHVHPYTGVAMLGLANTFVGGQVISGTLSGISTLTATTLNVTTVNATTLNGTLGTAAQPGVTSLGTLTSLTLAGALSGVTSLTMSGVLGGNTDHNMTGVLYVGPGTKPLAGTPGDIIASRGGASPGTGVIYFGSSAGNRYIYFDGTGYRHNGAPISAPRWGGSAFDGAWDQIPIGYASQCRQLFTANTRNDAIAQEGDLLFNG